MRDRERQRQIERYTERDILIETETDRERQRLRHCLSERDRMKDRHTQGLNVYFLSRY